MGQDKVASEIGSDGGRQGGRRVLGLILVASRHLPLACLLEGISSQHGTHVVSMRLDTSVLLLDARGGAFEEGGLVAEHVM